MSWVEGPASGQPGVPGPGAAVFAVTGFIRLAAVWERVGASGGRHDPCGALTGLFRLVRDGRGCSGEWMPGCVGFLSPRARPRRPGTGRCSPTPSAKVTPGLASVQAGLGPTGRVSSGVLQRPLDP